MIKKIAMLGATLAVSMGANANFNGAEWGSSRDSIQAVEGLPNSILEAGSMMYHTNGAQSVAGYKINTTMYNFKKGCSKLKESVSQPCQLTSGSFGLMNPSESARTDLMAKLGGKYGAKTCSKVLGKVFDPKTLTMVLGGKVTQETCAYSAFDGGTVTLFSRFANYDYTEYGKTFRKGLISIALIYKSPHSVSLDRLIVKAKKDKDL